MTFTTKTLAATTALLIAAAPAAFAAGHEFDVTEARLDLSLDTNGDGVVTDDEIIDGNEMSFDFNSDGAVSANERGVAQRLVMMGDTIELQDGMAMVPAEMSDMATAFLDFDTDQARLDLTLDTDGNGEITDDEIIEGNMMLFDMDNSGAIDAEERGFAEAFLENS